MAERDEMITHFKDVTGVDSERAQFHLESAGWVLDVALANFFEGDSDVQEFESARNLESDNTDQLKLSSDSEMSSSKSKSKSKQKSKFSTLNDLQNKDNSSEDEEGQAFYAGGSSNSGQQILGPGKKDVVSDMFKSCKEHAVSAPEENKSSNPSRPNTFSGTGYKLGMTSNDSEVVSPGQSSKKPSSGTVILKLWQNGFTINDQNIRLYNDPANQEFLEAIKRREVPAEIRELMEGAELQLNMEDHRHEEYIPPKAQVKAFAGKGQMLGSPSPAAVGMTIPNDLADQAANEALARSQLNLNTTEPLTTIQIRLADGSNVRAQFNLSHTVDDIRRFIITMRPQYALREFILQTTYPTKELSEGSKTINEANLQNTAIMQRLK